MNIKIERFNNLFVKELSEIFILEITNPILKDVCITSCDISNDLSYAKVYFTTMNEDRDSVLKALNDKETRGFLRTKLCERIDIRHTPELSFVYDNSIEYGKHIEDIIDKIHENE